MANPNYPGRPPWSPAGTGLWSSVTDYCGSVFAADLGEKGTLLQYGGAGHSAVNALFWIGFDVATLTWRRVGPRPLPTNGLSGYAAGVAPDPAGLDHLWGDWNGGWHGFPEEFRQPGIIVPEGSHTRNRMVYRPALAAGNGAGEVIIGWHATGARDTTGLNASHTWNADTAIWSRHSNRRPAYGAHIGGLTYHAGLDVVTGPNANFSSAASSIDVFDCKTRVWTRRSMSSGGRSHSADSTAFAWRDGANAEWHVICEHWGSLWPPMRFFAVRVDDLVSGAPTHWWDLSVDAESYPASRRQLTYTVNWSFCPSNGNFYAVNREHDSHQLWRLMPPLSRDIRDPWRISAETLNGDGLDGRLASGTPGVSFDYSRLQWSNHLRAFLWTPDFVGGSVQAIRPGGVG